jgi:hypothetical protein
VPARGLRHRLRLAGGALVTGPLAFLVSGLIDVAIALRVALGYAYRTTIRSLWAPGRGS